MPSDASAITAAVERAGGCRAKRIAPAGCLRWQKILDYLLEWTGLYPHVFIVAASAYLVALGSIQLLVPKLEAAKLEPTLAD